MSISYAQDRRVALVLNPGGAKRGEGMDADIKRIHNPTMATIELVMKDKDQAELNTLGLTQFLTYCHEADLIADVTKMRDTFQEFFKQVNEGNLIEFKTSQDPGVVAMRDRIGLKAPVGFAYVLTGCDASSERLRQADLGTTFYSRWIQIVPPLQINTQGYSTSENSDILSRELIRAYINASINTDKHTLPKWFLDGCALYYSGQKVRQSRTVIGIAGGAVQTYLLPMDKQSSLRVFQYLGSKQNGKLLDGFVKKSIESRKIDEASLKAMAGTTDFQLIMQDSSKWDVNRITFYIAAFMWLVLLIICIRSFIRVPSRAKIEAELASQDPKPVMIKGQYKGKVRGVFGTPEQIFRTLIMRRLIFLIIVVFCLYQLLVWNTASGFFLIIT
jgi:hypothetical protein